MEITQRRSRKLGAENDYQRDPQPGPMPAEAVQLLPTFDADRLVEEMTTLRSHAWDLQRIYGADIGKASESDWRCLALRSPGGDGSRTDPGGPGTEEFADTPWLRRTPYVREVLGSVPAPLRAVRFMALGPGAAGHDHNDTKYGLAWGVARLHVPVTTNAGALLVLDGVAHQWQPGSFWFGDFSRMHHVENRGTTSRVHLVIDCLAVPELNSIFPGSWRSFLGEGEVLFGRHDVPLPAEERRHLECTFQIPASFADWEERDGAFLEPQPTAAATVQEVGGALEFRVGSDQRFRLVHVGGNEFRFTGWSEERTVQLLVRRPLPEVILRTRVGRATRRLSVPAQPRSPEHGIDRDGALSWR